MSAPEHKDPNKAWLIFFFVCFIGVVVGIGVWAKLCYDANAPEAPVSGGH